MEIKRLSKEEVEALLALPQRNSFSTTQAVRSLNIGEGLSIPKMRNPAATFAWYVSKKTGRKFCTRKIDATTTAIIRIS